MPEVEAPISEKKLSFWLDYCDKSFVFSAINEM